MNRFSLANGIADAHPSSDKALPLTMRLEGNPASTGVGNAAGVDGRVALAENSALAGGEKPFTLKRSILVVEDSLPIRAFMRRALVASGHDVFEAGTAYDAYRILRAHPVDLVTLDLGLPDEDGLEFLRTIRKEEIDRPVIVCSVRNDRGTRETAKKYGAESYLAKPFNIEDLLFAINAAIDPTLNTKN